MSDSPITLYSFPLSGNAHRVELALSLMGVPYTVKNVDLPKGEQRSDWFKKLNPLSKVPVIEHGDTVVSESIAILIYLAAIYDDGTWLPNEPKARAEVQKWLTLASTELAQGPATARLIGLFGAKYDKEATVKLAHDFLSKLDASLEGKTFLVGDAPTLADIAIYSYVAHAPEGYVSLEAYGAVNSWIKRVEALENFTPMVTSTPKAAA